MGQQSSSRRAFWLAHIEKWRASGGTLKAYAMANELPVGTFYAAKSAYAREPIGEANQASPAKATFVPVQLSARAAREPITITLPNAVRIQVPSVLSVDEWRTLLGALSAPA
jgi:hypothetical protein